MSANIPNFPNFTELKLTHKSFIDEFTSQFRPYSDFNFVSLFCWDVKGTASFSMLNNNLVISLPDYISGEKIYSILGENQIDNSINQLFNLTDKITLVPEVTIEHLIDKRRYIVKKDSPNFDYIYNLSLLSQMKGGAYKKLRNKANKFEKVHQNKIEVKVVKNISVKIANELSLLFEVWANNKNLEKEEIKNEHIAIKRLLKNVHKLGLFIIIFRLDNQIIGFSVNEDLRNNYALCHFEKAIIVHDNVYSFMVREVSQELVKRGCKLVNWEQDLGLEGLKKSKLSYKPVYMLNKYTILKR